MTSVQPPRGPRNPPFLGQLPAFRRDPLNFLHTIARRYGDVAAFRLGPQPTVLINHPDLIKDVLVTQQRNFVKGRGLQRAKALLGAGLLTSEGAFHLRQRRLVAPAFHRQRIVGYAATMIEHGQRMSEEWQAGATLDVWRDMMRLTLGIVGKTLFDAEVADEANEIGRALTTVMQMFRSVTLPGAELLDRLPLPRTRRFQQAKAQLDATIYRIIAERRRSNVDRGDLLSMLLLAQDEETGATMNDLQIRDEAMTLFLAGHETTANALTWTWYLLAQNPTAEARMHAELDAVLGGRSPSFDDLPRLGYTQMVLTEAMRLYPPAWILGRLATTDYRYGAYFFPAGTLVLMSQYVMHRSERFFPNPERFEPRRWTPEFRTRLPRFAYFPFGGGPRVCIGESFAWTEGVLLLATLAQHWRLRLVPEQPVAPQPLVTLRPKYGMSMTLERRT